MCEREIGLNIIPFFLIIWNNLFLYLTKFWNILINTLRKYAISTVLNRVLPNLSKCNKAKPTCRTGRTPQQAFSPPSPLPPSNSPPHSRHSHHSSHSSSRSQPPQAHNSRSRSAGENAPARQQTRPSPQIESQFRCQPKARPDRSRSSSARPIEWPTGRCGSRRELWAGVGTSSLSRGRRGGSSCARWGRFCRRRGRGERGRRWEGRRRRPRWPCPWAERLALARLKLWGEAARMSGLGCGVWWRARRCLEFKN